LENSTWLLFASTVLRQSSAWYKSGEIHATTKRLNNFSGFNQGMSVAPVSPQMEEDGPRGIGDVASSKPCCKNGHEMVISDYAEGGYQYGYVCDSCFGQSSRGHCGGGMERWACTLDGCSNDICFECFPRNAKVEVKCNNDHLLVDLGLTKDNGRWACDGMRRPEGCASGCTGFRQSKGWHRLRCDVCDYDLCRPCHQQIMMNTAAKMQKATRQKR
jgi:hypothetical protein